MYSHFFVILTVFVYWYYSKIMSGKEFNRLHKGTRFYKYIGHSSGGVNDMTNRGYKYTYGINTFPLLVPNADCSFGGLYFSCQRSIRDFAGLGDKLFRVTIPDYACVTKGRYNKWKANAIIISELGRHDINIVFGKRSKFHTRHRR